MQDIVVGFFVVCWTFLETKWGMAALGCVLLLVLVLLVAWDIGRKENPYAAAYDKEQEKH